MSIDVNVQALGGFATAAAVTANNVANSNTPGFKQSRTEFETGPDGEGMRVGSIDVDNSPGPAIPASGLPEDGGPARLAPGLIEGSNTDIGTQMVDLGLVQNAYAANVAAVRTQDQLAGTVLDMIA
ncbi:protein of unknown function DUF1078 domain protein [Desulfovibrio sp. X2]|uniref:flagellar basal body rod C-terminal domain-containing protein n=1 Tax=Desulfovibrio sp. X2 TaxID=941449 RepID=UPI000358E471|nr:flagellar basal body rod C-terminal domain-containing protein [Desulfovibrio sp. X2]EPR44251.1 protein of unknown function DUF1078 domain protein [Desulfovibrio sp. X2]